MTRLPIRWRLTLAFAAVMAVVLGGACWYGYHRLAAGLDEDLDRELAQRAQDVSGPLSRPDNSLRELLGSGYVEHGESFAELLTPQARVVQATPTLRGRPLLRPAQARSATTTRTTVDLAAAPGLDEPARLLAVPFTRSGRHLVLVVGATRENGLEVERAVRGRLLVAAPLLLLVSSGLAYLLAAAALRPVEVMRRQAAAMSSAGGNRLAVPRSEDELSRLARTLNDLLARLDAFLDRERRFVSLASHEVRTPLTLLRTELDLARRRQRTEDELRATVESASAEVDRLIALAEDLLVLARDHDSPVRPQLAVVRLGELVDGCIGRRTQEERERIETAEAVETEVLADRAQLARALHNLLDNALVHGGGTVRVAVVDGADGVEVHVLDEGPGVDPEVRPHAFDRFAHRSGSPGAGLGLPVVAEIARAHGGGCGLADRDGGGTDAWLMLPRRPGAAAPTAPAVGAVASRRTAQVQARRAQ